MTLEEALDWADKWGPLQSDPPCGDGPALLRLAAEVRRLRQALRDVGSGPSVPGQGQG
jgi:hypothetical protein